MSKKTLLLIVLGVINGYAVEMSFFLPEYLRENQQNNECSLADEMNDLKNKPFIAISLGQNCFPALHFREYGIRIRSFPFDWDITPFPALYAILENDFAGFLDRQNLKINHKEFTVFNNKYQCKLNHDFNIDDWYDGPEGLMPRSEESIEKYKKTISYYQRRIARFYAVFDLGVPIYLFRRIISASQARQLNDLLMKKFPTATFILVCIQDEQWDAISEWTNMPSNILHFKLPHPIDHKLGYKNPVMEDIFRKVGLIE